MTCTELGMLSKLSEEFEERNCKLLAVGIDSKMGHRSFIKDIQVTKPNIISGTPQSLQRERVGFRNLQ